MENWKYYLLWLIVWPFYLLDKIIFFEIEDSRFWDEDIWLQRILIWHDNHYSQTMETWPTYSGDGEVAFYTEGDLLYDADGNLVEMMADEDWDWAAYSYEKSPRRGEAGYEPI